MPASPLALGPAAAPGRASEERLVRAARSFEALFLQMLLRTMRESQLEEGLFGGGTGASTWDGMFDEMMADSLAERSPLGIAESLLARWSGERADAGEVAAAADAAARSRARAVYEGAATESGVSSPFGPRRDPIDGSARFHAGADLRAPAGTPVLAVAPGTVRSVGRDGGYGLSVVLEHPQGWTTRYAHLESTDVRPGDRVSRGRRLGSVGATGRATGPHLHFEARKDGEPVDPNRAAPGPLSPQVLGIRTDEP